MVVGHTREKERKRERKREKRGDGDLAYPEREAGSREVSESEEPGGNHTEEIGEQ
jgi:hypothetical protein